MYNCIYHSFNIYNTVGTAFIYMWENALNSERGEQETHTIRIPTDNSIETLCFCYVVFWLRRAKLLCFCNLLHVLLPYGLRSDSPIWIMTLKCRCNFMLVKLWILHKFEWFRLTVPMLFIINCKKCISNETETNTIDFLVIKGDIIWVHLHWVKSHWYIKCFSGMHKLLKLFFYG